MRVDIPGPRLKTLLGLLALRATRPVTVEQLIDAAWAEGQAPPTAARTIRSQVAHLRRALRRGPGPADAVRADPPGYLLDIPRSAVDAFRFEAATAAARDAAGRGDHTTAAAALDSALALWRGDVLSGCALHGWAAAEATRLTEARLVAIEDRHDLALHLGDYRGAVTELEYLVACHPYRERLWELLMLALYGAGRRADALTAFRRVRELLCAELGVDPGPRLRELEALVLRGGPLPAGLPAAACVSGAVGGAVGRGAYGSGAEEVDPVAASAPVTVDLPEATSRTEATGPPDYAGRPDGSGTADGSSRPEGSGRADGSSRPDGSGTADGSSRPDGSGRADGSGAADGAVAATPGSAGRVPSSLTRLVGREDEIKTVVELVSRNRLVTLSGVGGCGKTRLAMAVCGALDEESGSGRFERVCFVDLGPVTDGSLVPSTIAAAFGAPLPTHLPLADALMPYLARRSVLLVLDNCEHVVTASALAAGALLTALPTLRVLATSREALGTAGELVHCVPPLPVPAAEGVRDARDLLGYAGVTLFAERANIGDIAGLSAADARGLATLCAGLEGLPLSLELAAARARVLSLPELAGLLGDRFGLLSSGARTGPPRHRSLRACVERSYELIDPDEQAMFQALAVFPGTFDLPAVTALGVAPPGATLDLVHRLVVTSLLSAEPGVRGMRYRLLDTIRQFAVKLLAADPARRIECHDRHAEHFRGLAEELDAALRGPGLDQVLDRLGAEHDNIRAALRWMTGEGADPAGAVRLAGALWQYCYLRGHYREGRAWLAAALEVADGADRAEPDRAGSDRAEPDRARTPEGAAVPPRARARAVEGAAALAAYECDYGAATALADRGLALYTELGDRRGMAQALTRLGSVSRERGRYERAAEMHRAAMALFEQVGDAWGIGHSRQLLGFAHWLSGDFGAAREWSARALRTLNAVGDKERIAWTLVDLGAVALYRGEDDAAAAHCESALRLFDEVGFKEGIAWAENLLGLLDLHGGRLDRALERLERSAALHIRLGDRWRLASVLEALAHVAAALDAPAICADLLAAAGSIRQAIGAPTPTCERPLLERTRRWLGPRSGDGHADLDRHVAALRERAGSR